jgi:hypothetical protein
MGWDLRIMNRLMDVLIDTWQMNLQEKLNYLCLVEFSIYGLHISDFCIKSPPEIDSSKSKGVFIPT